MRKISIKLLISILSLALLFATVIFSFAEEFEIPEIEEVTEEELVEVIDEEEVELFADASTAVCYIGEEYFDDIDDAIYYTKSDRTHYGKTIKLLKNCTLDGVGTNETRSNYYGLKFTLDGLSTDNVTVYTLSVNANININGSSAGNYTDATFTNVTLDLSGLTPNFISVTDFGKLTLGDGATVTGGTHASGQGGGVFMNSNSSVNGSPELIMESGSKITNCTALWAGGIRVGNKAILRLKGGTVENCTATTASKGDGIQVQTGGKVYLSGDTVVANNTGENILLADAQQLVIDGSFNGNVVVNYTAGLGEAFGMAESGASITGDGVITNATTSTPATISEGSLVWDYACYVGTDTAANRKYSLNEALKGKTAKTVYLVRDAIWEPHEDSGVNAIANLTAVINGNGYTLTPSKQLKINVSVDLTFENVTVDLNELNFAFQSGSKLTLNNGAHIINGGTGKGQGGAITIWNGKPVITMNEGSSIKDSKAEYGGAMVLKSGATLIMNGGEISGNRATVGEFGGGVRAESGAKVIISGNAKIEGNRSGAVWETAMDDNLQLLAEDVLTVTPGFTGHIGIWYEENAAEGKTVGVKGDGLTSLPSVNSITNDANSALFGWINSEGSIIWQAKPVITPALQYGTYAEGQKGIIRFTNAFTSAPATAKITAFGTYVLDNQSFSESDMEATENKFFKTEQSISASGKNFITDIHTGDLTKAYTASSFCYIEGIEAPVFTTISAEAIGSADGVIELSDEAVAYYESQYKN